MKDSDIWKVVLFGINLLLVCLILNSLVGKTVKMVVKEAKLPKRFFDTATAFQFKIQTRYLEVKGLKFNEVLPFLYMFLPTVVAVGTFTLCICIRSDHCHLLVPIDFFRSLFNCILLGLLTIAKGAIQGLMWLLGCHKKIVVPLLPTPTPVLVLPEIDEVLWKVPLLVIGIVLLAVLLFFLARWLYRLFKRMRLDNTILLINSDGRWEYAPSPKRLQIDSVQ